MDLQIAIFINKLGAGTFIDPISTLISDKPFLVTLWLVLLTATCFFNKQHRYTIFLAAAISIIIHFSINDWFFKDFLANFFELRIRPYLAHPELITPLGTRSVDASFPSGHMASTVLFITIFVYFLRKISHAWLVWLFGILFALTMAFSRIHNGMHYLTDVLAGAVLGIIYSLIGIYLSAYLSKRIRRPIK